MSFAQMDPGTQWIDGNSGDITPLIAAAVGILSLIGGGRVVIPNGSYTASDSIILPQECNIEFAGEGQDSVIITMLNGTGKPLFSYQREVGRLKSNYYWHDMTMQLQGFAKTLNSAAVKAYGYDDGHSENAVRMERCSVLGFEAAVSAKWCGRSHITDCFFANNRYSAKMARGSSFWWFTGCMSFDATFISAIDTIHDAFSNGLFVEGCSNVTGPGECMVVEGWQAVWVAKCGFDLGSAGIACCSFKYCTDVTVEASYISSNNSATRVGVLLQYCARANVLFNTVVNNSIGVHVYGTPGVATRANIIGNCFDGNATNDVLLNSYSTGCKVKDNHFSKQQARTGYFYELYANTSGSDFNILRDNTFKGSSYPIISGTNSLATDNIFGVTAG